MADRPRFSITIPAYNAQATLARTIESVQAQTFPDWELVIVDDGSTDDTRSMAERFAREDARVHVVSQENRGSGGAYNTAVRSSRSDLLVVLSADDLLLPDHLAEFDACIRANPGASLFTSDGWYEYDDGRREAARPQARWSDPAECTLEELLAACFYGVGAVYRREVFDAVGGFREGIYAEDYLFWLLALAHGFRHRHIATSLSVHRRSEVQKSANAILMRETDLRAVTEVMGSGLLPAEQMAAARRSAARLRRVILARRMLQKTIGPEALERLAARGRSARTITPARQAQSSTRVGVTFINNFPGSSLGGGEVQLLALLRGLTAADVQCDVVCAAGSALERQTQALEGVGVMPADFAPISLPSLVSRICAGLPDGQIVQGTGFLTDLVARRVGARAHVPVINAVHVVPGAARLDGGSRGNAVLRAGLDRLGRRDVWRFVAVSQAVRAGLIANGVRSDQISVIPNGVDPARLREAASAEPPPTLRPAAARVGSVGRLERVKGTEYFLRAAARLAADHPDVRYVVAGTGSCERELRELAVDLGIAHLVEFLGYVGAAPPLIASLDIVIVPSLSEASGLTAMEAMALGVPVVASFAGGLSEVVENGRTGLLVPPADAEAIARAVARLLDNPELGRRLAAEGERHVAKRFTVGRMVDAYLALYEEILATQARRT